MGRLQSRAGLACVSVLLAFGSQSAVAQSADAQQVAQGDLEQRRAIAAEIVDLGIPVDQREELFFSTIDQMTGQMRDAALQNVDASDTGAVAILDAWIAEWTADGKTVLRSHIPNIMDGWKMAYADMYSVKELSDIRDFVATPTGAKFFIRQQELLSNPHFAKANQDYMNEVMAELPAAQRTLMSRLAEYFGKKANSKQH